MLKDYEKLYPFLDTLPIGVVIFKILTDENGKPYDMAYEYVNEAIVRWVGKPRADFKKYTYFDKVGATEDEWLAICSRTAFSGVEQHFIRYGVANKRWLDVYASQPEAGFCFLYCIDISGEKDAKEQLSLMEGDDFVLECAKALHSNPESPTGLNTVLELVGDRLEADRVYILESRSKIISNTYEWCREGVSSQMANLTNIPQSIMSRWDTRVRENNFIFLEDIIQLKQNFSEEYEMYLSQGIKRLAAVPLYAGEAIMGYIGVDNFDEEKAHDSLKVLQAVSFFISSALQNAHLMEQLKTASYHDTLTGALNRTAMQKYIRDNLDKFFDLGIVYCDVNGLKTVNDEFGHREGDFLICEIYNVLTDVFEAENVYRIGGDEFVAVMNNTPERQFNLKCKELIRRGTLSTTLNFACGSFYMPGKADMHEAMKIADERMYDDKKVFYTKTNAKSTRYRPHIDDKFGMTDSKFFRELMSNGQMIFYLQPKVNAIDETLHSCEALVRYKRANGEIVSAFEFINILESTHYIGELDFHIIREVCCQISDWLRSGITPVPIAVNLSKRTICDSEFMNKLEIILRSCPIPCELLEFEITESVAAENRSLMREHVKHLRDHGFSVAIDDFGVDQSNFINLTDMAFDILKMDRSLIKSIVKDKFISVIVKGLVDICHSIDMRVVAEGVETIEQVELLRKLGVDIFQGWYYAKALPPVEFKNKWLSKQRI